MSRLSLLVTKLIPFWFWLCFYLGGYSASAGYFLVPDYLGEKPPMRTERIDPSSTIEIFKNLNVLLDAGYISDLRKAFSGRPVVIMVTSMLSEQQKMTLENEVLSYREFLKSQGFRKEAVLLIKPHPRSNPAKNRSLQNALNDLFSEIIVLDNQTLFFIPFEVFFMEMFLDDNYKLTADCRIVTFSTACLPLSLLFKIESVIGFGDEIVRKFFYGNHIASRIEHESVLRKSYDLRL